MEEDFRIAIYNPGSDVAAAQIPGQIVWGRTGNDALIGSQPVPPFPNSPRPQVDIFIGDLAIDDPAFRGWEDTFILGDWEGPYYANTGGDDYGVVLDFNLAQDTIQLHGSASDYQLVDSGPATQILYQTPTGTTELVGVVLSEANLSLNANYFDFRGTTPPTGPVLPEARQLGTVGFDLLAGVATDSSGAVYAGGSTTGSIGATNAGITDAVFAKYDSQGNLLFTRQLGTSDYDAIFGVETDSQGNLYVSGYTGGELGGPQQAQTYDAFVAKFDANGNQQWIRQIGENSQFPTFNLAVDDTTGDVFFSGPNVTNSIENPDDTYVIKLDTNGNEQWRTTIGTSGFLNFDESYGITVGDDGGVYATGWTNGNLAGQNQGVYDNWLARLNNATGTVEWTRQYGTSDYEWSWAVETDSQNNVYTTGWTLGSLGGSNAGSFDAYITKFDNAGNEQWIRQFGTSEDDEARDVFIDADNNLYVTGYTRGALGGSNAGSFDAWVAKYDANGNRVWITQFGTPDREEAVSITGDSDGNLYITGTTQGSLGALNQGSFDGWVAKLDANSGDLVTFSGDLDGSGGNQTFDVGTNDDIAIANFTGVGPGTTPSEAVLAEADTVRFAGSGLTARNLLLTQNGSDLVLSFEGNSNTKVTLRNFKLEDLDNLSRSNRGSVTVSNLLFNERTSGRDSFDVINADDVTGRVFNRNTVTFLNDFDNNVSGFDGSNDVINGQGGNDFIAGLGGDDLLRGGTGDDTLDGGRGRNTLVGNAGADRFILRIGNIQIVNDFKFGEGDRLELDGLGFDQVRASQGSGGNINNTLIRSTRNNELLAVLNGVDSDTVTRDAFTVA
jgi:hypothetical protein